MEKSNADRFIAAFKRIENTLREALENTDPDADYSTLIGEAAKSGFGPISAYQERLHRFGYLRNAIVHSPESPDGEVIAQPRIDVVEEIEKIAANLKTPPTVDTISMGSVYSVYGNQLIRKVSFEMKERDFSQAPVTDYEGQYRTLLTTNSIARWFAEAAHQNGEMSQATVDDVLSHREEEERCVVLSPEDTVFDVLDAFDAGTDEHIPPYAAVVTDDGSPSGELKGILTPFDLPAVFDELSLSRR